MYAASMIAERNRIASIVKACHSCGNDNFTEIYQTTRDIVRCKFGMGCK